MSEPLLSIRDLSVAFSQGGKVSTAVDHVSFDIARGETVALVGESGSGKSVSALSVLKLLPYPAASHPSGQILFDGKDLLRLSENDLRKVRGNQVTMIFQEPMTSLNPLHTIEQQITEMLLLHRDMRGSEARARTLELLHDVGIQEPEKRLGAYPHQLSGGQRQRVMIAMALANEPELLIADEPTTALDVTVQAQILHLLAEIKARKGMSMLFITHDLGIVRKIADRVCVMTKGKIVETGRPPKRISPEVALCSCWIVRPIVDLPEPLSPTSASVSPGKMSKLTFSMACTRCVVLPNRFFLTSKRVTRSRTDRIGAAS